MTPYIASLTLSAVVFLLAATPSSAPRPRARVLEQAAINDNRTPGGVLRDGVLTIRLEVREVEWHPDGDSDPGITVRAFAEAGKPATIPGPLVRVSAGTEIHAFVHNVLPTDTIDVHGLCARGGATSGADTVFRVPPGETREVRFRAGAAGTYYYRGTIGPDQGLTQAGANATLAGAFVVDPRGTTGPARDRVFVLGMWSARGAQIGNVVNRTNAIRFTANGKSWPNTERLAYTAGDSVHFRVINTSVSTHPMHLHGFYFAVRSRGDGTRDSIYDRAAPPERVVTETLTPRRTFSMSWVPDRPGNWLFHCHDNFHVTRNQPFDGTRLPPEQMVHVANHALEMMGGLVMGIEVRPRGAAASVPRGNDSARRLRVTARVDSGSTDAEPAFRYAVENTLNPRANGDAPTIVLKRGEPVRVTVVNALGEPTAVHWHGMELDSYFDGVPGFAGHPGRIAPVIAPGDSFEARFTPPRSGTFMYHPHADEFRQQQAGLTGVLLVVDDPATYDPTHDVVLMISAPRRLADRTVLINGSSTPPPLTLRVGERYRLRLADLHTSAPLVIARLTLDSALVNWRAIAKDGMTLPRAHATMRSSQQAIGNGETYDFEFMASAPGDLRFAVVSEAGAPLATVVMHVR